MQKGKILALDYGKKRIGLASGDLSLKIASPQGIIDNKNLDFAVTGILDFCRKWEVKTIVVGLPISMDEDKENEMSKSVRKFEQILKEVLSKSKEEEFQSIEVLLFDERLSSFEADSLMSDAGKTTRDKKEYRDTYAACIILQRFFDSLGK
ncbi:MAG: Holliday junction resolvase RuvX [Candidatus Gracilibacteria bacterium]|jgi:putative Holliday junction resolvase